MVIVYLGIGSNIGDKKTNCEEAVRRIKNVKGIAYISGSSFYSTKPVGGPPQDDFINGVVKIETEISPEELLDVFKKIEEDMGRQSSGKDHPRIIDIDILLYGDMIMDSERLTIPHKHMHERHFALKGMIEIAPELKHPMFKKTMKDLYDELITGGMD